MPALDVLTECGDWAALSAVVHWWRYNNNNNNNNHQQQLKDLRAEALVYLADVKWRVVNNTMEVRFTGEFAQAIRNRARLRAFGSDTDRLPTNFVEPQKRP